jgi:phosphatidylinositol 4-kinase type 2
MDEADIASSLPANAGPAADLMGFNSNAADMPNPGRFEISTPTGSEVQSPGEPTLDGPDGIFGSAFNKSNATVDIAQRPSAAHNGHLSGSFQSPSRALNATDAARQGGRQQRRYSFAKPTARRSNTTRTLHGDHAPDMYYATDDLEGDLGYAAAEGQMGNQRKVIVERLEAVKSRNPVFTWC